MAAEQGQELSLFELASAKLSDAQKVVTKAGDLLKRDAQNLMAEARELMKQELDNAKQEKTAIEEKARQVKSAIEEITKTLNQVHFASTVKLNVGGKIYKTTLDTLRKDPDSMLCAMFSGRFDLKADEEDGAYFIDRDAELFRYILNYLRNGELLCKDDRLKEEVLAEAKFYQVQGIINQLEEETAMPPLLQVSSLIINDEKHLSALTSWLPPNATCSLLFRASTDGYTPADFHRCCDNKGPTLVVIKSGEYIFGGYTSQSWESPGFTKAIPDSQSFLFTLVNPSGNEPVKITPNTDASIKCYSSLGPSFGKNQYCDLVVWSHLFNPRVGYLALGYGFKCPKNVHSGEYFTGKSLFDISELEVFKVNL
ncbi:uncharacterized protein LOC144638224 isoform X3 [Oculina patagonica]